MVPNESENTQPDPWLLMHLGKYTPLLWVKPLFFIPQSSISSPVFLHNLPFSSWVDVPTTYLIISFR